MHTDHSKIEVNRAGQITAWCGNNGQGHSAEAQPTPTACNAYGRFLMWRNLFPEMSPAKIALRANDYPAAVSDVSDVHPVEPEKARIVGQHKPPQLATLDQLPGVVR